MLATSASAHAQTTSSTAPYGPPPKAYIVVDQATGAVLAASNERTPLPPASLTKILTALAAVAALQPTDTVPVSQRAADMPAHKLNMKAGDVWPVGDVLSSLLASSANDAAAALAERVSGSLEDFHVALDALAAHLRMADAPTLQDAAGLDDSFSVRGGNLISARDLAIAARAVLAQPRLSGIVASPITRFTDPDGIPHRLVNHNKLLTRYPGAIGMKTGYTRRAGRGLIAAATRDGRTEIAVVLNVADTYGWAAQLLDAAFAQPVPKSGDRLPAIPRPLHLVAATLAATREAASEPDARSTVVLKQHGGVSLLIQLPLVFVGMLLALWSALRARLVMRRRRRRLARAHAHDRHAVHRRPRTRTGPPQHRNAVPERTSSEV
jgi:D-alanyl-D-alanine carboxypeptidase (penicillin-binding protein 5/6)